MLQIVFDMYFQLLMEGDVENRHPDLNRAPNFYGFFWSPFFDHFLKVFFFDVSSLSGHVLARNSTDTTYIECI